MSDYKFPVPVILQGLADVDQMQLDIKKIINLLVWLLGIQSPCSDSTKTLMVWEGAGDRKWEIVIRSGRILTVAFVRGHEHLLNYPIGEEMRFYAKPLSIIEVHEYLQDFMDGMVNHYGAQLGERLKVYKIIAERPKVDASS